MDEEDERERMRNRSRTEESKGTFYKREFLSISRNMYVKTDGDERIRYVLMLRKREQPAKITKR